MEEDTQDFAVDLFLRPVGVLVAQVRGLEPTRRPIELPGGVPPLLGRHVAERGDLLGSGLLVGQHGQTVPQPPAPDKSYTPAW